MNINTTNPRRSIWFSQLPPVNKADVWLSYNRHYSGQEDDPETENDESIEIDSLSQRKCDLVMKIWDCGEWKPILGYNSTAANKMNTVNGVEYSCTLPNNYGAYSVTGYTGFHMPLFRNDNSSPDELFDAGTVGNVLLKFVSENEWKTIIEDGGLGDAVEFNFPYAGNGSKGGIWADMFSNSDNPDTSTANKTYLAQAKYKYQTTQNDYNLFVHAKDLIEIINTYITENPSGDTIDIDIQRATTTELGGIKASAFRSVIPQEELAEACFNDNLIDPTLNNDRLYVWAKDIMQAIESYTDEDDSEIPDMLYNWFQSSRSIKKDWNQTDPSDPGSAVASKPQFSIWGANDANNAGKVLRMRTDALSWEQSHTTPYTESNNILEWVDPSGLFEDYHYDLNVATTTELGGIKAATHTRNLMPESLVAECKFYNPLLLPTNSYKRQALCIDIKDVKSALDAWYASNDSTPLDLDVYASNGVDVSKSIWHDDHTGTDRLVYWYGLNNYPDKAGLFPRSTTLANPTVYGDTNGLEWVSLSLDMMSNISFSNNIANGDVLIYNNGLWTNGLSAGTGGAVYSVFDVNLDGLVPGPSSSSNKLFLRADGLWVAPPDTNTTYSVFTGATASTNGSTGLVLAPASGQQTSVLVGDKSWKPVSDVFNINTNNNVITANGDFTLNNNILSADYAGYHTDLGTLYPWNYYIISCGKSNTQFNFSISSARSDAGNPIYIRINTDDPMTLSGNIDYINSNDVFTGNTTLAGDSSYLLTIQFEIIKIEKIASTKLSGGGNAEEPAS